MEISDRPIVSTDVFIKKSMTEDRQRKASVAYTSVQPNTAGWLENIEHVRVFHYLFGLRGQMLMGGPGAGMSIGNISTHISSFPCDKPTNSYVSRVCCLIQNTVAQKHLPQLVKRCSLYSVSTKNGPPKYNGVVFEIVGKHH